jgi:hypothetical protein
MEKLVGIFGSKFADFDVINHFHINSDKKDN